MIVNEQDLKWVCETIHNYCVAREPIPRHTADICIGYLGGNLTSVHPGAPSSNIDEGQRERVLRLVCAMIVNERFGFSDSSISIAVKSAEKIDRLIAEGATRVRL